MTSSLTADCRTRYQNSPVSPCLRGQTPQLRCEPYSPFLQSLQRAELLKTPMQKLLAALILPLIVMTAPLSSWAGNDDHDHPEGKPEF